MKWLVPIVVLFIIQTITFNALGPILIKGEFLDEVFLKDDFIADSVFVRDYSNDDCTSGNVYVNEFYLNLKADPSRWEKKLNTKKICFAHNTTGEDVRSDQYPVFYIVEAVSKKWTSLHGFYECRVDEHIRNNTTDQVSHRRASYRWCLFFWIKTSEYQESWKIGEPFKDDPNKPIKTSISKK